VPSIASMYSYLPDKLTAKPPILVLAHYCGGTASGVFGRRRRDTEAVAQMVKYAITTYSGGQVTHTPQEWDDLVRGMSPGYSGHRPRMQLFHGDGDGTINDEKHTEAIKQWTDGLGLSVAPTSTDGVTLGRWQQEFADSQARSGARGGLHAWEAPSARALMTGPQRENRAPKRSNEILFGLHADARHLGDGLIRAAGTAQPRRPRPDQAGRFPGSCFRTSKDGRDAQTGGQRGEFVHAWRCRIALECEMLSPRRVLRRSPRAAALVSPR